ncbi:MAG: hypothetical protein J0L64_11560 [Acidobacteria bacterium]|nr:hypothetical protein [Acidobacteriota bacterium]
MRTVGIIKATCACLCLLTGRASCQTDFEMGGKQFQVHGFASQGFAYSNQNNFLSMKTSDGSFALTDGGVNISSRLTPRFRVGAQVYMRNVGNIGNWRPTLDWAYGDYRFNDWIGIRAGRVKTAMGLYNDTQDAEFVHTYALLPQAVYSLDLREATIAHNGVDAYGSIPLRGAGTLAYTVYTGKRQDSIHGGYPYLLRGLATIDLDSYGGVQWGGDLKWMTPLSGFLVGASHMNASTTGKGIGPTRPGNRTEYGPYKETSNKDQTSQFSAQYTVGALRIDAEYRRYWRDQDIYNGQANSTTDARGWYTAGAYRISKRFEAGSYFSRFVLKSRGSPSTKPGDFPINDKVITLRTDVTKYWNVKVEGHFIRGNGGGSPYPTGFYRVDNPAGLFNDTNMLLIRTGWNF